MFINKEELLKAIEKKYGDLTDYAGCGIYNNGEYEWLSVGDIVDIINECCTYDDED